MFPARWQKWLNIFWAQYYLGLLGVSFIVTAPYMSMPRWQENYLPPLQHKVINSVWYVSREARIRSVLTVRRFSAFQIVGAWANTGKAITQPEPTHQH